MNRRVGELKDQYREKEAGRPPLTYIPTGLPSLDAAGLLEPGILTIGIAHPGDGKSSWGLQLLEGAARAGYRAQGYFIEDPEKMLSDRVISPAVGESAFALRRLRVQGSAREIADRLDAASRELDWIDNVDTYDEYHETASLMEAINDRWTPSTKLVVVDYAQAFDSEHDEKSVERVLARLGWQLNQLAKTRNAAVVLMSQPKTREVEDRGRRWFESCRWKARKDGGDPEPTGEWVEGFRPTDGDIQWATGALKQRARQVVAWFRPGRWMRTLGVNWKDDTIEATIPKGNYGPSGVRLVFGWDGPRARILERKKK